MSCYTLIYLTLVLYPAKFTDTFKLFLGQDSENQFGHKQGPYQRSGHENTGVLHSISVRIQWDWSGVENPICLCKKSLNFIIAV